MGSWNAYNDPNLSGLSGATKGWAEISASQPIFGVNRLMFRDGITQSSPFTLFDDEPFAQTTSGQQFAPLHLKKWPVAGLITQWTDLVVNNPSTISPVTITVRIRKTDKTGDLTFFTRRIPARGSWSSSTDPDWLSLPDSDTINERSLGWIELTSSAPVVALSRTTSRNGSTATSAITHFENTLLQGNLGAACDPSGPAVFCPISTMVAPKDLVNEFKELVIVHPSVVNDARASSPLNGHWSFRWLMEQMVTSGADPSDFVESWIINGFAGAPTVPTFNGFSLSQREAAQVLLDAWPRIAETNKLDLTQPPFVLLAIVNRVDLASGSGAGEGRFVFGVNMPNSGGPGNSAQRMTVIFEYKLPPSASRQVWAQRFHALGALPLPSEDAQSDFNARLQMITDEFTRRGADPAGVNGSSLGQLRTNELLAPAFLFPWQWREVPCREVFMKATLCAGNCPDVGPAQMTASRVH